MPAATPTADSKPKHTPGPCRAEGNAILDSSGRTLGWAWAETSPDEDRANAVLWAASADFLVAAEAFVALYADLDDDWLREMVSVRPGDLRIVDGRGLTAHVAASILAFRAAIRAARTGERA